MSLNDRTAEQVVNGTKIKQSARNLATLKLTGELQNTLDRNDILNRFATAAMKFVAFDGVIYSSPNCNAFQWGMRAKHHARYQLQLDQQLLGEVVFYRKLPFQDEDMVILEYLLCSVVYPLRNAEMYEQALNNSLVDSLTGISNRGALDTVLEREIDLAKRHHIALSLLVIDIDKFKRINDQFGHSAGDLALKHIVSVINDCTRRSDVLFRYGGEEFVLLLRNTTIKGGLQLAERIRGKIENRPMTWQLETVPITVSIGVAGMDPKDSITSLFEKADNALYQAKRNGRNQVIHSALTTAP